MQRIKSLDFLRGIAVILVFFNHFEAKTIPDFPKLHGIMNSLYWKIKSLGWSGVDLFFVLSGFLISGLLFKEIDKTGKLNVKRFWLRRAFKILPSYFLILFVLAITKTTAWLDYSSLKNFIFSLFSHLLFFQNYLTINVNGPTWSLAIEEHFYLFIPLFLFFINSSKNKKISFENLHLILLLLFFSAMGLRCYDYWISEKIDLHSYQYTHFRFDSLLVGVLLRYLMLYKPSYLVFFEKHKIFSLFCGFILVAPAFFFGRVHAVNFTLGYSFIALGYGLILFTLYSLPNEKWNGIFIDFVSLIGQWSYNIYLWHFFILTMNFPFYKAIQNYLNVSISFVPLKLFCQFTTFTFFSIAIGGIITSTYENFFLKVRKRFFP